MSYKAEPPGTTKLKISGDRKITSLPLRKYVFFGFETQKKTCRLALIISLSLEDGCQPNLLVSK